MNPKSNEERIARVIAESERLRILCAEHMITITPYIGCTGLQFYQAVSVLDQVPVVSVSESKVLAVEDVVWKLNEGWGKG